MKICLINNLYKPYERGGAENIVELIADGLKKSGHEVFVITTKPLFKPKTKNQKPNIYYINGLYYNLNKIPKFLRLFWHLVDMFDVGSFLMVRKIFKKEKPDVVMTHNLKGISYLIPKVIKKLNIKHIHTLHDIQLLHPSGLMFYGKEKIIGGFFSRVYQGLCRWLFGSPDIVISPSKWLLGEHANRGFFRDSKRVVLPAPTPSPSPAPASRERGAKFKFLYVGQIEKHKGVLFLINSFKLLCGEIGERQCELIVVGDGSRFKKAQQLVGQNKNIKLIGRVEGNEVSKLMLEADCLVVPSLCYENSPTVIYEAMSNGLPVIASHIGGIPELVENNGLLFEPKNEDDLITKMKWAVEHKEEMRGMGDRGKVKVKEFEVEGYVERLMSLL